MCQGETPNRNLIAVVGPGPRSFESEHRGVSLDQPTGPNSPFATS